MTQEVVPCATVKPTSLKNPTSGVRSLPQTQQGQRKIKVRKSKVGRTEDSEFCGFAAAQCGKLDLTEGWPS